MAVDFLGKEKPKPQQPAPTVPMYVPGKVSATASKSPLSTEEKNRRNTPAEDITQRRRVNLLEAFYRYVYKRRLLIGSIFAILVAIGCYGYLTLFYTPASPQTVVAIPKPLPTPTPVPTNTAPTPTPALPDTPLAPLRGSLVRFRGLSTIFLVENNGELRTVNTLNVVFKNGQNIGQIDRGLIYLIADQYRNTRRGTQDVNGQVDYDPRVLLPGELDPFL